MQNGFGNAGVHLPHGMSYPVSGMVKSYVPPDYPPEHPTVPHGMSVILNAPAVFRWTGSADPENHLRCAELMGTDVRGAAPDDAGEVLASSVIDLMKRAGLPNERPLAMDSETCPLWSKGHCLNTV